MRTDSLGIYMLARFRGRVTVIRISSYSERPDCATRQGARQVRRAWRGGATSNETCCSPAARRHLIDLGNLLSHEGGTAFSWSTCVHMEGIGTGFPHETSFHVGISRGTFCHHRTCKV